MWYRSTLYSGPVGKLRWRQIIAFHQQFNPFTLVHKICSFCKLQMFPRLHFTKLTIISKTNKTRLKYFFKHRYQEIYKCFIIHFDAPAIYNTTPILQTCKEDKHFKKAYNLYFTLYLTDKTLILILLHIRKSTFYSYSIIKAHSNAYRTLPTQEKSIHKTLF